MIPQAVNLIVQARLAYLRESQGEIPFDDLDAKENTILTVYQVVIFTSFISSVFVPLKLRTPWFYVGFVIYGLGIAISAKAIMDFSTTPKDTPVTQGIYRISRNPMYVGWFLAYIGIGVASASPGFMLLVILIMVLQYLCVASEERWCLEEYGDVYRAYMKRTPRWIGIAS